MIIYTSGKLKGNNSQHFDRKIVNDIHIICCSYCYVNVFNQEILIKPLFFLTISCTRWQKWQTKLTFAGQKLGFSEVSFALFRSCSPVLSIKKETSTGSTTTLQSVCCVLCQHADFYAPLKEHRFTKSSYNHKGPFKEENELKMKEHGKVSCTEINGKSN